MNLKKIILAKNYEKFALNLLRTSLVHHFINSLYVQVCPCLELLGEEESMEAWLLIDL